MRRRPKRSTKGAAASAAARYASDAQAVTSRALRYNALTSVVLTSIYCDLFSDVDLFRMDNPERNRRLGAPLMLLVGAVSGGLFAHSRFGISGALWTATALKVVIVFLWVVWPGEEEEDLVGRRVMDGSNARARPKSAIRREPSLEMSRLAAFMSR